MREILISVQNKIAVVEKDAFIVCGNEDYTIKFSFDKEWSSHNFKTALFVFKGKLVPVAFTGNVCSVPIVRNSTILGVGVKSSGGELITTTPAYISCKLSAEDISNEEIEAPSQSVYDEIVELLNQYIEVDITSLQQKTDERLETDNIDIVGAINEVNEIAKQANKNSQNGTVALKMANEAATIARETADFAKYNMVAKTEQANQLYGTDENGNQVLYPTESVGTKVFVDGQKVNEFNADGKFDKTGGVIGGDVSVQGNLSVSGTTTTKDTETVMVKENVIVANSDGDDLVEDSGFAIKTSKTSAYGIMYCPTGNPADDGVKIGLGSFTEDGKFVFDEGEAQFLATRADTLTNGNIPQWDNEKNQFVDSGKKTDDFVPKANTSGARFAYTNQEDGSVYMLPIDYYGRAYSLVRRKNMQIKTGTPEEDDDVPNKAYVDDNFVPTQQNTDNNYRQVYILNQDGTNGIIRLANAIPYQAIPIGDYGGCIFTGDPTLDYQAANKKYVDDNKTKLYLHKVKFSPYGDETAGYITFISMQKDKFIDYNYNNSGMDLVTGIPEKSFERKFKGMILVYWINVTFSNLTLYCLNGDGQIATLDGETDAKDYTVEEI